MNDDSLDPTDDVLVVDDLHKTFGTRKVVKGVSFRVAPGEIVGLLGPNGAGKSTCFRMTCGLMTPDRGRVALSGRDVTTWPLHRRAREGGMGYLAQESSVFRKLTVEQNLLGVMELMGMPARQRRTRCEELLEQLSITHIRSSKAEPLSGGEKRRLEIARCLIHRPRIIMLDEPFAGIDPVTVQQIQVIIQNLRQQGISVWITDHAAREILQVVDRVYVVIKGEVVTEGHPSDVRRHPKVREAYLGNVADSHDSEASWMADSRDRNDGAAGGSPVNRPSTSSVGTAEPTSNRVGPRRVIHSAVTSGTGNTVPPPVAAGQIATPTASVPPTRRGWFWRRETVAPAAISTPPGYDQTSETPVDRAEDRPTSRSLSVTERLARIDGRQELDRPRSAVARTPSRGSTPRGIEETQVRVLRRRLIHEQETLDSDG